MDLTQVVTNYIARMAGLSQKATGPAKMKILLLDDDTLGYVSAVSTQRAILAQGISLIDRLDNNLRDKMRYLQCICFIRPTTASIQNLVKELQTPKYGEYYIYFSNTVKKTSLQQLAESDDLEVVKSVEELFIDYLVINPDLFSLSLCAPTSRIWSNNPSEWNSDSLSRSVEGLLSVLQSLKKKPVIRYSQSSGLAGKLAREVQYRITEERELFEFRKPDTPPILLILDRRDDPITPLLTQWTYQAMVHELLGIHNGRVDLSRVPGINAELEEIVLSQDQDPFFKNNMFLNFGDLGENAREYVKQFSSKSQTNSKLDSIEDMKKYIEQYPEFQKLSTNVTKHVNLVGELSRLVGNDQLFDVSRLEQSLSCNDNHNSDLDTLQKLIRDRDMKPEHKIRLAAIYALRYGRTPSNSVPMILGLLEVAGNVTKADVNLIHKLVAYHETVLSPTNESNGNTDAPFQGIFQASSFFASARDRLRGVQGVENVYTQHNPTLQTTIHNLVKGRLREDQYPVVNGSGVANSKVQDVIIFMVGGATYEEARTVAKLNGVAVAPPPPSNGANPGGAGSSSNGGGGAANNPSDALPGVRIILGGTTIHNSSSFWEEVETTVSHWPTSE